MISNTLKELGAPDGFIGHYSPYEFLIFTEMGSAVTINERLHTRLEKALDYFYPVNDRDKRVQNKEWLVVQTAYLSSADGSFNSPNDVITELSRRRK